MLYSSKPIEIYDKVTDYYLISINYIYERILYWNTILQGV
ncbi:hypothetical protein XNW1_1860002 [Xenorhabdus nematophila str. Websteri]|nr:hypothetical protein XNW1_1860002 [Xenorhabdus nematophila str. Websteri]